MADPKKADLLIALGGLKGKSGAEGDDDDDGDEGVPAKGEIKSSAAADVMAALKSGSVSEFEDALTRFVGACSGEGY